jgi:Fe-S oxidoreductase
VTPQANDNQIALTDKCSKPCCGCPELETLVEDQKRVRDQVQTLANLIAQLEGSINTMNQIVTAQGTCT